MAEQGIQAVGEGCYSGLSEGERPQVLAEQSKLDHAY